jgi:hypothetical protein
VSRRERPTGTDDDPERLVTQQQLNGAANWTRMEVRHSGPMARILMTRLSSSRTSILPPIGRDGGEKDRMAWKSRTPIDGWNGGLNKTHGTKHPM